MSPTDMMEAGTWINHMIQTVIIRQAREVEEMKEKALKEILHQVNELLAD